MLRNLAGHDAVVGDIHIPLLIWWGIEAKAESDRDAVLALFDDPAFWRRPLVRKYLVERILERYAAAGGRANLMSCVRLFRQSPDAESTRLLVKAFEEASRGRLLEGLPPELVEILAKVGGDSLPLGVRQGRAEAVAKALRIAADPKADIKQRLQLIETFGEVDPAKLGSRAPGAGGARFRPADQNGCAGRALFVRRTTDRDCRGRALPASHG